MSNFAKHTRMSNGRIRTLIIVLVPVFLFLVYSVISVYGKSRDVAKKDADAHAALSDLESRQKELGQEIDKLHTGAGVEEILRDKYRAVKEGEGVVVIVDDKTDTMTVAPAKTGFWSDVKGFFGGN